jgi:hypothetical protein
VTHRKEFAKRMMEYRQYSESYDPIDVNVVVPPVLPSGVKQHVFVTHDESTFYSNDYQKQAWTEEDESYCLPKSQGRSIMISEFQCSCHGTMRGEIDGEEVSSRTVFYPGANFDTYWKSENMVEQLTTKVMPLFKLLHPDMIGVFLFDQSSNHKAFSEDALVASKMNMNPTEIKEDYETIQGKFRQGYYYNPNLEEVVDHSLYIETDYDYIEEQKVYSDK